MINSVRQTVMSVLNKNNYGYISPSDFNLFAKQAQLDLFENYFYQYNYQLQKENARQSGTGYADITKGIEEVINTFSETRFLQHQYQNRFFTPSESTTGDNYYLLNKVLIYSKLLASGTNDGLQAASLIDSNATFIASGVKVGDIVVNLSSNPPAVGYVSVVVSDTELTLVDYDGNPFDSFINPQMQYLIYSTKPVKEAEKVTNSKITMLNNSILTAPNLMFPAYSHQEPTITLLPDTINQLGAVQCQYIRFPRPPRWTYVTLPGGEPAFDQTAADYQDFELPKDDEVNLVNKILQYAGMSIREVSSVQFAQAQETANTTTER